MREIRMDGHVYWLIWAFLLYFIKHTSYMFRINKLNLLGCPFMVGGGGGGGVCHNKWTKSEVENLVLVLIDRPKLFTITC